MGFSSLVTKETESESQIKVQACAKNFGQTSETSEIPIHLESVCMGSVQIEDTGEVSTEHIVSVKWFLHSHGTSKE